MQHTDSTTNQIDMIKFTTLLIGCSLALAGAAVAQKPDAQESPAKQQAPGKSRGGPAKETKPTRPAAEARPDKNAGNRSKPAARPEAPATKSQGAATKQDAAEKAPGSGRMSKSKDAGPAATRADRTQTPAASAAPSVPAKGQTQRRGRDMKDTAKATPSAAPTAAASASATVAPTASVAPSAAPSATPATAASATAAPAGAAVATAAPSVSPAGQHAPRGAAAKKPDPQQIQQIKQQHASFRAKPRPDKVPTVTFQQNHRIQNSERWQGPQYEVYRSYRPERHDRQWYHSHYQRVELVGGGYYYWNNGYWYPAWGYSPQEEYYAYDAPIYVGQRAEPPDRVIAEVQATLQQMGYYKGEVDGLLGPLTREALVGYQNDQGLTATAVIDEPTLDTLGMG